MKHVYANFITDIFTVVFVPLLKPKLAAVPFECHVLLFFFEDFWPEPHGFFLCYNITAHEKVTF